jgi:hypothetical protein
MGAGCVVNNATAVGRIIVCNDDDGAVLLGVDCVNLEPPGVVVSPCVTLYALATLSLSEGSCSSGAPIGDTLGDIRSNATAIDLLPYLEVPMDAVNPAVEVRADGTYVVFVRARDAAGGWLPMFSLAWSPL